MPFRSRQAFRPAGGSTATQVKEIISADGNVTAVVEGLHQSFPEPKIFELQNLLDAGVPLQQTVTRIISSSEDLDAQKILGLENENTEKKEVTDENE